MLDIHVRHRTIIHRARAAFRHPCYDSSHVASPDPVLRDQLNQPMGEASQEEVLVRQRQLATSYDYYLSMGFSYRFGSIFNNVVNARFANARQTMR